MTFDNPFASAMKSLGCFTDSTPRALTLSEAPDCGSGERAMSPSICASYCATVKGAVYFGVEFSYEVSEKFTQTP